MREFVREAKDSQVVQPPLRSLAHMQQQVEEVVVEVVEAAQHLPPRVPQVY